jgi:hypothetical protein
LKTTEEITLEEYKPKFLDSDSRYNNWYFAADFTVDDKDYNVKLSITEGSLLGQFNYISLSKDPLAVTIDESDGAHILKKPPTDINLILDEDSIDFSEEDDHFKVIMGDLEAYLKPKERRIVSKNDQVKLDLTFKPRGPVFYWGKEKGALCDVTEETKVAGIESLSIVEGTIETPKEKLKVTNGRGLFERVWFGQLNFFQIRIMDWLYANFDELYTYLCHTESVTNDSQPYHFETAKIYLKETKEYLFANKVEVIPESWVFLEEAKRFIPFEQSVEIRTEKGRLKMMVIPRHYPQLIQEPARLEAFMVDNIPGWNSLFYDFPVKMEGEFVFNDGEKIELRNGKGINELIRLVPL